MLLELCFGGPLVFASVQDWELRGNNVDAVEETLPKWSADLHCYESRSLIRLPYRRSQQTGQLCLLNSCYLMECSTRRTGDVCTQLRAPSSVHEAAHQRAERMGESLSMSQ